MIKYTKTAPRTAPIGSTIALKAPIKKALIFEVPFDASGKLIAIPSGKFCMPIPTVKIIAALRPALPVYKKAVAKATPMAIPSGIL